MSFVPKPVNTALEIGSKARIPCRVKGPADTIIKWYRFSFQTSKYMDLPQGVIENDGLLYFRSVQSGHAGYYACVAHSSAGSLKAVISVDVISKCSEKNVFPSTGKINFILYVHKNVSESESFCKK